MPKKCVNRVELIGNLVRDAETKFTQGGAAVTNFTIATSRSYKQGEEWKEESQFTNVVAWRMDKVANFLTKGKQIRVEGRLQTRNYEKDGAKVYVTEVVAEDIMLLGGATGEKPANGYGKSGEHHLSDNRVGITDDDIPF